MVEHAMMFRSYIFSVACLAFSSACTAATPEAGAVQAKALNTKTVPCWFDTTRIPTSRTLVCRYVTVPQWHPGITGGLAGNAQPGLRPLQIAVVVAESATASSEPPLFVLGGGPEATTPKLWWQMPYWESMAGDRDIVVHDYRGVGYSKPSISCDVAERDARRLETEFSVDRDTVRAEDFLEHPNARKLLGSLYATCAARGKSQGVDYRAFTARQIAADVDAIAGALGFTGAVDLVGESYGTRLAQVVAMQHPARVRRAVVDGVSAYGLDYIGQQHASLSAVLDRISRACYGQPACRAAYCGSDSDSVAGNCELFEQHINEVAERLHAKPVEVTWGGVAGGSMLTQTLYPTAILSLLGLVSQTPTAYHVPALVRAFHDATEGRTERLARLMGLFGGLELTDQDAASNETLDAGLVLTFAAYCADYRTPQVRIAHQGRFRSIESIFLEHTREFYETCGHLGITETDAGLSPSERFSGAFLTISGEFDAITTMESAALVRGLFGADRVQQRVLTHGPHVATLANSGDCARSMAREFLATGNASHCTTPPLTFDSSEPPASN